MRTRLGCKRRARTYVNGVGTMEGVIAAKPTRTLSTPSAYRLAAPNTSLKRRAYAAVRLSGVAMRAIISPRRPCTRRRCRFSSNVGHTTGHFGVPPARVE